MNSPATSTLARLKPEQVAAKYCTAADANWSAQAEADFFAELDSLHPVCGASPRCRWGRSTIPEDLLRDFARDSLKAKRCSVTYLEALRRILWHLHMAELEGREVRISTADGFGSVRSVRTITDQLAASGATYRRAARTSSAHSQVMSFFKGAPDRPKGPPASLYQDAQQEQEDKCYRQWVAHGCPVIPAATAQNGVIDGQDVSY